MRPAVTRPWRRAARAALLAALTAAGCAPSSHTLLNELEEGAPGQYVRGVPFVRQRRHWCGPAALAAVLQYHGLPVTQEQVADEVYLDSLRGSLTLDLARCARRHGLWCHAGQASADELRAWLDRGVPVIALLRENWLLHRPYHYVVLVGYHAERGYFLAHTGTAASRPISFARLARQHAAAGRWFLAAAPPEKVVWPLDADGHNDLALLLERRGSLEAAQQHLSRAIALEPNQALYHFNLGNLLAARCPSEEALRAYREALRLEPEFADAHNNLAWVLLRQDRPAEALPAAERAAALGGPRSADYHHTLGRVLLRLGRHAEAVEAFRTSVQQAGEDAEMVAEARLGLIEALLKAGRRQDALAEKRLLLRRIPDPAVRRRADALLP